MIQITCPHCRAQTKAADEHAGKKAKCPSCKGPVIIPATAAQPVSAAIKSASRKVAPPLPPTPPPAPVAAEVAEDEPLEAVIADEEDEEAPRPRRAVSGRSRRDMEADELEEEDEGPRPQKRLKKKKGGRKWARCPHCGARDATKVHYTWWGGFLGPMLINTVACNECGTKYNGRHGDYNTVRIAIYTGVFLALAIVGGVIAVFTTLKR